MTLEQRFVSRKSEVSAFENELLESQKALRELPLKIAKTEKLLQVATTMQKFIKDISEMAAQQSGMMANMEDAQLIALARDFNHAVSEHQKNVAAGKPEAPANRSGDTRFGRLHRVFLGNEVADDATSEQVLKKITADFRKALNSTLPQLESLLEEFFPKKAVLSEAEKADHQKRELSFLSEIAKYLRLNQAAVGRGRATVFPMPPESHLDSLPVPEDALPKETFSIRDDISEEGFKQKVVDGILITLVDTLRQDASVEPGKRNPFNDKFIADIDTVYDQTQPETVQELIEALYSHYQLEMTLLTSSENIRRYELMSWLVENAGTGNEIAFTPQDMRHIEKIIEISRYNDRTGDTALYGPPGTGKTVLVKAANKIRHMDTYLYSVHRHTSASDLIGESAITMASLGQPQENTKRTWVDGVVQDSVDKNQRLLLDEADKAGAGAFDATSYLFSSRKGRTVKVGDHDLHIPHSWGADLTLNTMNLPVHIFDRFTALKIDYPETDDLLRKVTFWLSSEHGKFNENVTEQVEWQVALFFTYIVPRIHEKYSQFRKEYEQALEKNPDLQATMHPFSMRGMADFCRQIAAGKSIDSVIEDEVLKPGVLAEAGSPELEFLRNLVRKFDTLRGQLNNLAPSQPKTKLERALASPLFGSIAGRESAVTIADKLQYKETTLDSQQLDRLRQLPEEEIREPGESYKLPSGLEISQEQDTNGHLRLTYSFTVNGKTPVFLEHTYTTIRGPVTILSSDQFGENLLVQKADGVKHILTPIKDKISGDDALAYIIKVGSKTDLSIDGSIVATQEKTQNGSEFMVAVSSPDESQVTKLLPTVDGQLIRLQKFAMSEDGSAIVMESLTGQVYLLFPKRTLFSKPGDTLPVEVEELRSARGISDWNFQGNLLWSPNTTTSFTMS